MGPRPKRAPGAVELGKRVRAHRARLGLTQERLAEMVQLHPTMVGRIERGLSNPTLDTLLRLADALEVDPAALVRGLRR